MRIDWRVKWNLKVIYGLVVFFFLLAWVFLTLHTKDYKIIFCALVSGVGGLDILRGLIFKRIVFLLGVVIYPSQLERKIPDKYLNMKLFYAWSLVVVTIAPTFWYSAYILLNS